MNKAVLVTALLLLLCGLTHAQDTNVSDATTIQELLQELADSREALDSAKEEARALSGPQILTVQLDSELKDSLQKLHGRMEAIEDSVDQYQEKFTRLRDDLSMQIEEENKELKKELVSDLEDRMGKNRGILQEYMTYLMNPIRMNLPNFALWLMVTGLFMLIWGRKQGAN